MGCGGWGLAFGRDESERLAGLVGHDVQVGGDVQEAVIARSSRKQTLSGELGVQKVYWGVTSCSGKGRSGQGERGDLDGGLMRSVLAQ